MDLILPKEPLLLMQFMTSSLRNEEFMMKVHFLWSNQLCRGIMEPFLLMDKRGVERRIQCLVLRVIKLKMVLFQMHLTIYSAILMMLKI